jgi:hypothetical protein
MNRGSFLFFNNEINALIVIISKYSTQIIMFYNYLFEFVGIGMGDYDIFPIGHT